MLCCEFLESFTVALGYNTNIYQYNISYLAQTQ